MAKSKKKNTSDAVKIMNDMMRDDAGLKELTAEARINAEVAQLIYDARVEIKLTQKQLAERVGTTQPVIARLENADYNGHSLTMLQRIACALNQRLEIHMLPGKDAA